MLCWLEPECRNQQHAKRNRVSQFAPAQATDSQGLGGPQEPGDSTEDDGSEGQEGEPGQESDAGGHDEDGGQEDLSSQEGAAAAQFFTSSLGARRVNSQLHEMNLVTGEQPVGEPQGGGDGIEAA